jgi:adenylate cyclase
VTVEQRRLAAILVADVVGYSKLVGSDEAGTLAKLSTLRRELIEPVIAKHAGRLFKAMGDGFLVEFASAVQAVTAAQAIQQANAAGPLQLRIGIHVGDVVVQGDDLMGDGVNIAARIEGVAEAGGIAISREVHAQVRGKVGAAFHDKGEIALKNIEHPIQVFALAGAGEAAPTPALTLPDKPSIAVLPFQNMSGDAEQEYFVDGLVEDITAALSRFKSLFVIARNSSFTYKGRSVDIKQVGIDLGVRYVLEGSVRKAGGRVRVAGQLIDSQSGTQLWADRFESALEDVFELQDRVTASVVGAIAPRVEEAEIERARIKPVGNLQAYDLLLQALVPMRTYRRPEVEQALRLLRRSTELDPAYARAFANLAACSWIFVAQGFGHRDDDRVADLVQVAKRALALNPLDSEVVTFSALLLALPGGDMDTGLALIEKAMALNPNYSEAFRIGAVLFSYIGRVDRAIELQERANRLSPLEVGWTNNTGYVVAQFVVGAHQAVIDRTAEILRERPNAGVALRYRAASLALLGRVEEARNAVQRILEQTPGYTLAWVRRHHEFDMNCAVKSSEAREALYRGLRLAGLPEGTGAAALTLPDKPSIAVLPFQNMSGDPEQEYFADGIVEDIITALSRFKSLFVIARNSSFTYKGKAVDIKQAGHELGARYVLEGSIRKAANRLRITGQLIDSLSGAHLWADRFDGELADVFDMQDQVTARVVAAVAPRVEKAEMDRIGRHRVKDLNAYDCYLRGLARADDYTKTGLEEALQLARRAFELDPDFSTAYGLAAYCYGSSQVQGFIEDREKAEAEVRKLAERISTIGRDDAYALSSAAFAVMRVCRDHATSAALADQALAVNPNLPGALSFRAEVDLHNGNHAAAIEQATQAIRLSPRDPMIFVAELIVAFAHMFEGRYDQAIDWATRALSRSPNNAAGLRVAACAYALSGRTQEAARAAAQLLEVVPSYRVGDTKKRSLYQRPQDRERLYDGLRLAGVPE